MRPLQTGDESNAYMTLTEDVAGGDPLLDADRCEEEARKDAGEFLERENREPAENDADP